MKDAIIHKLILALTKPVITEAEAVYVLVELRKLLDRRKTDGQLPDFLNIRFCCDWAVHVQLHGDTARQVVSDAQDLYQKLQSGTPTDGEKQYFRDRFTLQPMREEILRLSKECDLPILTDAAWNSFLACFLAVIEDCPLSLRLPPGTIADVDEVVLTREMGETLGIADGKAPRIVWELKLAGRHVQWLTANETEETSTASAQTFQGRCQSGEPRL
jgi:hypothetical protein